MRQTGRHRRRRNRGGCAVRAGARVLLVAAALAGGLQPARAQMGPEDTTEDYWIDTGEPREERAPATDGPTNLQEARTSGRGIRLGSGAGLAPRTIPDSYTVRRGDTLWDVTGRFYGNPWQWPKVWSYNPEITNPHWIYPDDRLRLVPEGQLEARLPGTDQVVQGGAAGRGAPQSVLLRDQGFLDSDALAASGIIVGSPEEHMLLSPYDEVYIRFNEDAQPRPGMQMTIFRQMEPEERGEGEEGTLVRIFGTVELTSVDEERSLGRGVIREALDPIERGYRVADMPRRLELVEPVTNSQNVQTEVVAALRPHMLHGDYQVIFVNAGAEQGIQRGNRFFILRQGDLWRDSLPGSERAAGATLPGAPEGGEYPFEIIAEGRVVNVRPNTAALIVTRSTAEVVLGDLAEMRQGY